MNESEVAVRVLKVAGVLLVVLWIGLECGYRIGVQSEVRTHRAYIAGLSR